MKSKLCHAIIYLSVFFLKANAQAPDWLWAKSIGESSYGQFGMGQGYDRGNSIAVDASDNVYTTGFFWETVDFDPSVGVFNLIGSHTDVFISKLNAAGDFVWAKQLHGMHYENGFSLALDASNNIYSTGSFQELADFDPGPGKFNLSGTIFISKLDSSGEFVWAKALEGILSASQSMVLNPANVDIYITGYFVETVDFDPGIGTFNLTSNGNEDIFICKLDSIGNFIWAKAMGGTSYGDQGRCIALDVFCNVYTIGFFRETVDFNPGIGVFNLTSEGDGDIFISKLDSSGNFLWAKQIGGTSYDRGNSITLDASGNIYSTGSFAATVDFDPGIGVFNLTSEGDGSIFISKLDSSGNFVWAKQVGGPAGFGVGNSIILDTFENVYVTGDFYGTVDFDSDTGTFNITSFGSYDIFILKLDNLGNFIWAKTVGGEGSEVGNSIALNTLNNVHITGDFGSDILSFGSATLTNSDNDGSSPDIFIAKLDNQITGVENVIHDNSITIFPNPATNHFTIALAGNYKEVAITITDITGKIIYSTTARQKTEVTTKDFAQGVYLVKVQTADIMETKKVIVAK